MHGRLGSTCAASVCPTPKALPPPALTPLVAAALPLSSSLSLPLSSQVAPGGASFTVDGYGEVSFSAHAAPGDVPWDDHGVELVLECTQVTSLTHITLTLTVELVLLFK